MINEDMLSSVKTLLINLKALREETDALNLAFMDAMSKEDKVAAVRNLFPSIIESSDKSAAAIAEAFTSVNWELPGNKPQLLYDILSGVETDLPEEIQEIVREHLHTMVSGTEAIMVGLYGKDPMLSAIQELGILEELSELITSRDEMQALVSVMNGTSDMPVITQE